MMKWNSERAGQPQDLKTSVHKLYNKGRDVSYDLEVLPSSV